MAPDTVSIVKAAAKANDLNRLKAAMDAWMAEEDPEPPRDPRWPTSEIQAVLTLALDWGNIEVADELLKRGCYANYSDSILNALGRCTEENGWDTRAMELLLKHGWDPNIGMGHGGYPLRFSIANNEFPTVIWLLQNGADPDLDFEDEPFDCPLALAAGYSSLEMVQLLLKNGATKKNKPAFLQAAEKGHHDILQVLLDEGNDINGVLMKEEHPFYFRNYELDGNTALHVAVSENHVETVRFLLEKGAKTDLKNRDGKTARELAEAGGNTQCAELLA